MPNSADKTEHTDGSKKDGKDSHSASAKILAKLFQGRSAAWTGIFTGFLALFTFVLVIFTAKLYEVGRSADETARSSQRAFLSFASIGLGSRGVSPNRKEWMGQEFSLNWVNSGTTPAKDVIIQGNVQAWPSELPIGYGFPNSKDKTLAVIGPKATYGTIDIVSLTDLISAWEGKSHLYFWGTAVYKDIFPNDPDRLTEYCVEMTHITVGGATNIRDLKATITGFQWQACKEHNCYDDDCKDYTSIVKEMRQK